MDVEPYLFFEGRCEEAIALYARVLGAEVEQISRFGEMPEPRPPGMVTAENETKVMHARLRIGASVMLVSDGMMREAASKAGRCACHQAPPSSPAGLAW
jgi:PhnB protein